MSPDDLSDREIRVLEAVIQVYIETAEPAGSQTIAQRFPLGVSSATIRNTMSELEEKGFLYHPHTSAGRIPTDRAYRWYVDSLTRLAPPSTAGPAAAAAPSWPVQERAGGDAAARGPGAGRAHPGARRGGGAGVRRVVLEKLDLVQVSAERLLLVFHLQERRGADHLRPGAGHAARRSASQRVAQILNERLAGLTLQEIRTTLAERLRDAGPHGRRERELLNIFIEEGEEIFGLSARAGVGGPGQRADAGRAAGIRHQRPDPRPAGSHRAARPAAAGARRPAGAAA